MRDARVVFDKNNVLQERAHNSSYQSRAPWKIKDDNETHGIKYPTVLGINQESWALEKQMRF